MKQKIYKAGPDGLPYCNSRGPHPPLPPENAPSRPLQGIEGLRGLSGVFVEFLSRESWG